MLQQLKSTHYIKIDTVIKRGFMNFLYEILRLTRHDNRLNSKRIIIAYIHFES